MHVLAFHTFEDLHLMNKVNHLIGTCAWNSSCNLPVTPAQLMRPGIGQNVSCRVGDFADLYKPASFLRLKHSQKS